MALVVQKEADANSSLARDLAKHFSHWHLLPYALRNIATDLSRAPSNNAEVFNEFEIFIIEVSKRPMSYSSLLLSLWVQSQLWSRYIEIPANADIARACLNSILVCAATEGMIIAVDIALILGASATQALYTASKEGFEKIVRILVEDGADINVQGVAGNSLYVAAQEGYQVIVRLLLDTGADVNSQGVIGSALQAASRAGHERIVQLLLDSGADPNSQGLNTNALQAALQEGHERIVQLLLDSGADPNFQGVDVNA